VYVIAVVTGAMQATINQTVLILSKLDSYQKVYIIIGRPAVGGWAV